MKIPLGIAIVACGLPQALGAPQSADPRLEHLARSGLLDTIGLHSSERLRPVARLAPGDPPLLAFRYLEDRRRHRFGELDLMMDDAGH